MSIFYPPPPQHTCTHLFFLLFSLDTYELVTEEGRGLKFNIPHHFESNVKASGAFNNPARTRRLAQEAVTLSTSLPLSYNSSVFVRCDEERLDIMKVTVVAFLLL